MTGNSIKALERLYECLIINTQTIKAITRVSYPAAHGLLAKFTEYCIFRESTGRSRNRLFRCEDYIGLFN